MPGPSRSQTPRAASQAVDPRRASQDLLRTRLAARTSSARAGSAGAQSDSSRGGLVTGGAAGSGPEPGPSSFDPPPDNDAASDASARGDPPASAPNSLRRARTPDLEEWGASIKRVKTFSVESEAEWDSYCKRGWDAPERQTAMAFSVALENRDLLKSLKRDQALNIDNTLKLAMRHHAQIFGWSHSLTVYRGKRGQLAIYVLDVMRLLGIKGLPAKRETGQVKIILSHIGRELRDFRYSYLAKCKRSLKLGSKIRNIAALAHEIAPPSASATLAHYMRVALIRWHLIQYPDLDRDKFWQQVNVTIRETFASMSKEDAREWFNLVYEDDKTGYGRPEDSGCSSDSVKDVPKEQEIVEQHAARVPMQEADAEDEDEDEGAPAPAAGGGEPEDEDNLDAPAP